MKTAAEMPQKTVQNHPASVDELLQIISGLQQQLTQKENTLRHRDRYIALLEERLRLKKIQQFAASSEKHPFQIHLFDEAEMESEIETLLEQLPDSAKTPGEQRPAQKRRRGFAEHLVRERIELTLSDEEKAGASHTFFTKVKEELTFIPAQLKVLEYWQEKAVFEQHGESRILAAARPVHPLGKCSVSTELLAHVMVSKYADGLPLYRQEKIIARYGHEISRTNMAHWIIRLSDVLSPLMNLLREEQNNGHYIQMDETRLQVLKESGKTAQSDKWMWVSRGGPPDKPSVLFEYDPSRAGEVPERLLQGFNGTLQTDGHSAYNKVCRDNKLTHLGCWDHARRRFVNASKTAKDDKNKKSKKVETVNKADVALGYIRRLYAIESHLRDSKEADRYRVRQEMSVPALQQFKLWLDKNTCRVAKETLLRDAMDYTLNHWEQLTGYCEHGYLNISNILAENAIRPFVVGRKAWLFADTSQGARASAVCYSLIETAKANDLEPSAYIRYVLNHIAESDTLEKLEALLPWNMQLPSFFKKVPQYE